MRRFGPILAASLALALPGFAQDTALVPQKRAVLAQDSDLPGGDITQLFDTTLEACERACLSTPQCTAFTFNSRNGSCFPKANPGPAAPYLGAISAQILPAATGAEARASARRAELRFASDADIAAARAQAAGLGRTHMANGQPSAALSEAAAAAEARGDLPAAIRLAGAALAQTDTPEAWAEYARLSLLAAYGDEAAAPALREQALHASVNAYLRAEGAALRHTILIPLATAFETLGRGRDSVGALRLAQALQPRDDTAAALEDAIGKYGFRITDHDVQADSLRPRLCANFSEDLSKAGVDYETFVQLPEPGLTVTSDGYRQLCVEGLAHGARYTVTFREGLPAADGQELAKSVAVTAYVRDRAPGVRFPGRAYVLPKGEAAAIPVETVNTDALDLTLFRVTDRNLLRAFQNGYFSQPIANWQEGDFNGEVGTQIWQGSATVGLDVNRDVTTRLPLADALRGQPAGVYALKAAVPGKDPYDVPASWQWFVVSDLGLTSLSGVDGLHVFVRSLGTAAAKTGATVDLLSTANEVLGSATTDAMGYARFDAGLTRGTGGAAPALIVARDGGDDLAFLSLTDPEFDLSDRGVEGRAAAPPVDVFLTTDRGAYRAGETVYATALARDGAAAAVPGLPLTARLKRPDGVEYSRTLVEDSGAGGHVFALPIAGTAPRGVWRLEVLADPTAEPLTSRTFLVEDFLPERIDFDLTLNTPDLRLGDLPTLTVDARYLFGAPGADLAIEGEVLVRAAPQIEGFAGYVFGPHDEPFGARMETFGGDRTDAAGLALISPLLPEVEAPQHPLEARFSVRVAEGSGRPVERQLTQLLTPSTPMIGVRPLFEEVVAEGSEARFNLIGLGPDGKPTAMDVDWQITRVETNYQWYQSYGAWNWEPVITRSIAAEGRAQLGATPVEIAAPVQWGEYELRVTSASGAVTSTPFFAGWYAPADVSSTPDTLELSLDKPAYTAGDTATLRLVPRAAGTALVTVLSNRLIAMQAVEVREGENLISLPVTEDWGAGVYVTASVLRPMDVAAGRNPARALGLAHAAVDPGARQLDVTVETQIEAAPRAPLDVAVNVAGLAPGEAAWVTIAAVDQGILNLTAFAPPDPSAHYFGQRKLGVGIRDVYGRLIDGLNGAQGSVRSGGDAGAQARLQAPPPTEELVAYFTGPVQVGADGYARTSFTLPAFNGSVKIMAVAWSAKAVGQAHADVLVRDPVVVTASLPRFLAPGDSSRMLLEIVHATGPSGRMGLDVTAEGLSLGAVPSGFDLGDQAKATFAIPVTAGDAGLRTLTVNLTTPDGKQLVKTLSLPVQANDPEVARTTRLTLAQGQTLTLDDSLFAGLSLASAKASMAIGPLAQMDAPGLLAALDRYPYGCTEQITSKALPLLYFDQVAQAMDLQGADNIAQRIEQAVAEILTNQGAEGGFGLWSPGAGDLWLDAYVTDFLSRARAQGHAVPDQAFRAALDSLRNQVNYAPDFDASTNGGGEALAYALMVLAREGAAAIGDLRYYADVKADAFGTALAQAQLGAALASYGDQPRADAMFRRANARLMELSRSETEQSFRADYGTHFRDAAAILTLAVDADTQALNRDALIQRISGNSAPLSTQEATWALMATHALIDRPGLDGITLNGGPLTGPLVKVLTPGSGPVTVQNSGADTQLTLTAYGTPSEPQPAGGNGYAITRSYYTLDGAPTTLDSVRTGDRLVTVIEVTPFGSGEARLMVADPLPAGFEIDNPNLIAGGSMANLDWLSLESDVAHSEFRQDRFLTAIDRRDGNAFRLAYIVRAISPGTFHHPAASVEDMFRPSFRARSDTGRVTIAE
ncbi:alpha-2-macroglobulin family protein [Pseudorhodobacter sp. MZDSW-24AT]|uniref:alpha-2-macroglobulin family protein n=1 Tax=Pseudorhodobacter sp. MZDSW-24AT TaxID=2052957 RepID=UPI000C1F7EA8|nr:alpha-2-macroglobulin family protein [Pseudorhodobacter sp. MZDSW-24AT]PJF09717.1 PAN domain-containing protein [Pseudorhodobacter sp. MZDSW-24AT]